MKAVIATATLGNGQPITEVQGAPAQLKSIFEAHNFSYCRAGRSWVKKNAGADEISALAEELKRAGLEVEQKTINEVEIGLWDFKNSRGYATEHYRAEISYGHACIVLVALGASDVTLIRAFTRAEYIAKLHALEQRLKQLGIKCPFCFALE